MTDIEILNLTRRARWALLDEDLAQDAMVALLSRPEGTAPEVYLTGVIKNLKFHAIAAAIEDRASEEYNETIEICPSRDSPIDWQAIPLELRPIAELLLQGYSYTEISKKLSISRSALKMKLARHRNKVSKDVTVSPISDT